MSDESDEKFQAELLALVDGELDAARAATVLTRLSEMPESLRWLREQQQLKLAAQRGSGSFESAPADLRTRILAMSEPPSDFRITIRSEKDGHEDVTQRRWLPMIGFTSAMAAGLLIGLFAATSYWRAQKSTVPLANWPLTISDASPGNLPIEPALIVRAGRIHGDCSRLAAGLHSANFEKVDADLAATVRADLDGDHPYPDLLSVGFRFDGAGPCLPLMPGTIHLLYRSTTPNSRATVSLFVQPNHGQFPKMKGTNLYAVSSAISPFPMIAWETSHVVYFLVTDDERIQAAVLKVLNPRPTDSAPPSTDESPR